MGGAPFGDFAVVAREENLGDFHATKILRASILWVLNIVAVGERFDFG